MKNVTSGTDGVDMEKKNTFHFTEYSNPPVHISEILLAQNHLATEMYTLNQTSPNVRFVRAV